MFTQTLSTYTQMIDIQPSIKNLERCKKNHVIWYKVTMNMISAERCRKQYIFWNCSTATASIMLQASPRAKKHARVQLSDGEYARNLHFWELQCCHCIRHAPGFATGKKMPVNMIPAERDQKSTVLGIAALLLCPRCSRLRHEQKSMPVNMILCAATACA